MSFFVTCFVALLIPFGTLSVASMIYRNVWFRQEEQRRKSRVGSGAFREADAVETMLVSHQGPPWGIKLAALSCFMAAQMVIPGALAWVVGLMVLGDVARSGSILVLDVGLISFLPGVYAAWLVWKAGLSLLGGFRKKAEDATRAAWRFTLGLNVVLFFGALAFVLSGVRHGEVAGLTLCYAPLSILQAGFTRWMFRRHQTLFLDEYEPFQPIEFPPAREPPSVGSTDVV